METFPTPCQLKVFSADCPSRLLFDQVADKWSMMVLAILGDGPHRFNAIRRRMEGVTQKALTQCLRRLERNGLIDRRIIPVSPIGVEYTLTPLGRSLLGPFKALYAWMYANIPQVEQARRAYDQRTVAQGQDEAA
ncbi:Transcriptional regulator, HxlR family [Myxococcus hansupus]|uniref:Transcriptional regulator, HxlR family n=1 Tax=Pseudomyxococcus hansupus TaxID=1297742 RepID=A0A0H4WVR1_9BACT|nr:helix-turn-helix domain-containing protein [Myxococcus hansupus]AKQ66904.1 Transcriptional regulator, HxlR family [Myxococcus hansupus]